MTRNQKILGTIVALVAVAAAAYLVDGRSARELTNSTVNLTNAPMSSQPTSSPSSRRGPAMEIDPAKSYQATLRTSRGDIVIELSAAATPITVNNFVSLARKKLYDGTIFHRVIDGFMIQGGDPQGDGTGGPGYTFDDEPFEGEYSRGTVAMANAGSNTNGSQFFIVHRDAALPKNYIIFGHVTAGMDAVDAIATAPVTAGPTGEPSKPVNPVKVISVDIYES